MRTMTPIAGSGKYHHIVSPVDLSPCFPLLASLARVEMTWAYCCLRLCLIQDLSMSTAARNPLTVHGVLVRTNSSSRLRGVQSRCLCPALL